MSSAGIGGRPTAPSSPRTTRVAPGCINAGTCLLGCPQGAKGSSDVTYWPVALRNGVELETHCRVREITVGPNGMADGVVYYDADRRRATRQRAHVVVVACNGIGTPRLLAQLALDALPRRPRQPERSRREEPDVPSLRHGDRHLRRARSKGYKGPTGCCIISQEFYETDPRARFHAAATRSRCCAASAPSRPRCSA